MKEVVLLGDRNLDFITHRELDAALNMFPARVRARWIRTSSPEVARVADTDAIWVVPGSPYENDAEVYTAIEAARTSGQPFLGTCAGFQYAVVEFARNVAGMASAGHAETATPGDLLVVDRLACSLVAEERLVTAVSGTRFDKLCGCDPFIGFHWCNYGLAPAYVDLLTRHGLVISALAQDAGAEAIELPNHPFFLATLFQPQIGSIAGRPLHPIVRAFLAAA